MVTQYAILHGRDFKSSFSTARNEIMAETGGSKLPVKINHYDRHYKSDLDMIIDILRDADLINYYQTGTLD